MQIEELKNLAIHSLEELKAEEIIELDVKDLTPMTDYMIISTGRSSRHIHSIADNLSQTIKDSGHPFYHVNGEQSDDWALVDLGDVIVHIMTQEARDRYSLEKLWEKVEISRNEN